MQPREIDIVTRKDLEKANGEHGLIFFCEISHPSMDGTVRICTDGVDYEFDGKRWSRGYFKLKVLTDGDTPPVTRFAFDNVDRRRTALLEYVVGPPQVSFWVYSTAYFDAMTSPRVPLPGKTPMYAYQALFLEFVNVDINASEVSGTLRSFDPREEVWPARRVTKAYAPGVYYR